MIDERSYAYNRCLRKLWLETNPILLIQSTACWRKSTDIFKIQQSLMAPLLNFSRHDLNQNTQLGSACKFSSITMTSPERHLVLNFRSLDCLFDSLWGSITKTPQRPHNWPMWGKFTGGRWIPRKGHVMRKKVPFDYVIMTCWLQITVHGCQPMTICTKPETILPRIIDTLLCYHVRCTCMLHLYPKYWNGALITTRVCQSHLIVVCKSPQHPSLQSRILNHHRCNFKNKYKWNCNW